MAEKPKDPQSKGNDSGPKQSPEDLDKTQLDVDIRALDAEDQKKTSPENTPSDSLDKTQMGVDLRGIKSAMDETLIFERPPLDEEDTDLHGLKKKKQRQKPPPEAPSQTHSEKVPSQSPPPSTPHASQKVSQTSDKKEKAKKIWKELTSFTILEAPPQSSFAKIVEFVGGLVLLLLLLDICIEGLALTSPLSSVSIAVTILCVLVNVFFIVRKGNFHVGLELSSWAFLGLLGYSTWKYGSFDGASFSLIKHSPAQVYDAVFLATFFVILFLIWQKKKLGWLGKALFTFFICYGAAGFGENLLQGLLGKRVWNLEDTLMGTEFWKWLPFYYFRPVVFSFWILLPFLTFYFLAQKTHAVFKKEKLYSRESTLALGLVFLCFLLGNLILFKNHFPSLFSFVMNAEMGVGQTRALRSSTGVAEDYDIEVSSANAFLEKNNDALPIYQMGALFAESGESKKNIQLTVRSSGGVQVPFLKSMDLQVLQEQVPQKPIKVKFNQEMMLRQKNLVLLVDHSSSMASLIPSLDKATRNLYEMMNSREFLYWVPFADSAQVTFIYNETLLKKSLSVLFAQGSRRVAPALEKAIAALKDSRGEKAVFLITSSDPVLDDLSSFLASFKAGKVKFYGISLGEGSQEALQNMALGSGGKFISLKNSQNLNLALRSFYADAFGQYQITYEGQAFGPKFSILSPQNGDEIYKESPLQVKVQNWQEVKLNVARLYVDNKLLQEVPAQSMQDIAFSLIPAQLPKGSHLFKVALVGEGGKEFSQEIKLSISAESDFAFIRPLDGDVVSGQVNLEVYYKNRNQNPLQKVEFWVDGQKVGEASSEPYLFTWDAQAQNGSHMIQAFAAAADGSTKSNQIKVNVVSGFATHLISPSVGEFLNNLTEIEADVSHNLSEIVTKVEFYADGNLLSEVTQAPYKYLWDNSELASGRHVLQARAYSSNGWVSTDAVIVNIGNGSFTVQLAEDSSPYLAPDYIEWVLDASSSMNGEVAGLSKIELVKQALFDMFPKVPASTQVALRSFGASSLASHRDCRDSVLNYPLKALDSQKLTSSLNQVEAKGMSALAYALEKVKGDMKSAYGTRVVILITDGFDNCAGDPVGQLERWKKEKLHIKLYILGLDIEGSRAETELKRLASIANGQYYPVKNEKEMVAALEEMVKVTYRVFDYKEREVAQKPIGAPSVSLRTGEYRVEIDLEPPLTKEKVLINNGVEKKIILKKEGNGFSLSE